MVAVPLFCLSAGYGLFMLQSQFRMAHWRKLGASLIIVGCGFAIANIEVWSLLISAIHIAMKASPMK